MYAIDTFYSKERQYLKAEQQKITLLYEQFEATYQRHPDYRYLSQCLTQNILKKEHLFASHEKNFMYFERLCEYLHRSTKTETPLYIRTIRS
ncbi:hypothetical protein [Enterococcus faecium]|uniref:hypothetical protein n=1 Tax=Enterococcus faecium TaxID=1352 RepID=UPI0038B5CFC2